MVDRQSPQTASHALRSVEATAPGHPRLNQDYVLQHLGSSHSFYTHHGSDRPRTRALIQPSRNPTKDHLHPKKSKLPYPCPPIRTTYRRPAATQGSAKTLKPGRHYYTVQPASTKTEHDDFRLACTSF